MLIRAGKYKTPMNRGKKAMVMDLMREWRRAAVQIARDQWRLLFETGSFNNKDTTKPTTKLSARQIQTCRRQVVGQLDSFMANRANDFKDAVLSCDFDESTRIALFFLNKYHAWYRSSVAMQGLAIPPETLRIARNIMRGVLAKHRKPDLSHCNMALDHKVAWIEQSKDLLGEFPLWLNTSTLIPGKRILLPIVQNTWFDKRPGKWMNFAQVNVSETGELSIVRLKDATPTKYKARTKLLGFDVGLRTLLATSEGDLFGRDFYGKLAKFDRQISTLAANRQRAGLPVRSGRYDRLVARMRAYIENEVRRTLRRAIDRYEPKQVVIESLDFRSPTLSRRLKRLVQNFGRRVFKEAIKSYSEQYGFTVTEVNPAYTSQTCNACGYVDEKNRNGDSFKCLYCGHAGHADVNAARNHRSLAVATNNIGRSDAELARRVSRKKLLEDLVERFLTPERVAVVQREIRRQLIAGGGRDGRSRTPGQALLENPYFARMVDPVRWGPPTRWRYRGCGSNLYLA